MKLNRLLALQLVIFAVFFPCQSLAELSARRTTSPLDLPLPPPAPIETDEIAFVFVPPVETITATSTEATTSELAPAPEAIDASDLKPRIVNGDQSPKGRFPYVGFLRSYNCPPSLEYGDCGSSLITPRVVLTAGHCLFECSATWYGLKDEKVSPYGYKYAYGSATVRLNRYDLSKTEAEGEYHNIVGARRHELYKRDPSYNIPAENDLALLLLETPSKVAPLQLSTKTSYKTGSSFEIAGWGSTDTDGTTFPDIIRYASVPQVPLDQCRKVLGYNVWGGDICAGGAADNADTCIGDSGGPLVKNGWATSDKHRLVGVTSYGADCGEAPAVYVNIGKQAQWIDNAIILNNMLGYKEPLVKTFYRIGHKFTGSASATINGTKTSGECALTCKAAGSTGDTACKSWTYDSASKQCKLLKSVTGRSPSNTFVSGNITTNVWPAGTTSECQYDLYARYSAAEPLRLFVDGTAVASPGACCGRCKVTSGCQGVTYDTVLKTCQMWKGPSATAGWGRTPWKYSFVSAIVARQ